MMVQLGWNHFNIGIIFKIKEYSIYYYLLGNLMDNIYILSQPKTILFLSFCFTIKKMNRLAFLLEKMNSFFSKLHNHYIVCNLEDVFLLWFCSPYRKIKPLIITICICIILHKKSILVLLRTVFENWQKISTLKLWIKP